ncbi:MAG: hypothetical protein Q8P67_22325 [archaeon]|nr:hypothetical protein [archaeon]
MTFLRGKSGFFPPSPLPLNTRLHPPSFIAAPHHPPPPRHCPSARPILAGFLFSSPSGRHVKEISFFKSQVGDPTAILISALILACETR